MSSQLLFKRLFSSSAVDSSSTLKRTALRDFHVKHGGSLVPFAGWEMPVKYKLDIIASHLHTRSSASLFDVSHMGQVRIHGKDRVKFLESLTVGDFIGLNEGEAKLTLFTNETGGIKDDLIVTKWRDFLGVVVNAGCAEKDLAHLETHASQARGRGEDVRIEFLEHQSLLALQGPKSMSVLQAGVPNVNLTQLPFMAAKCCEVFGIKNSWVTRCGYTGEDGFEISIPSKYAVEVAEKLIESPNVLLAGLGARDTLRLEAGMCLYGHDIDENTTPIEAQLAWVISNRRRSEANFPGAKIILDQLKNGPTRRRVGLVSSGAAPREGTVLIDKDGNQVGNVTSGSHSPSLKHPISMAYVKSAVLSKTDPVQIMAVIRGKPTEVKVAKMPFVPNKYYKVNKNN